MATVSTGRPGGRPRNIDLEFDAVSGFKVPTAPKGFSKEEKWYWRHFWMAGQATLDVNKDYVMVKLLCENSAELDAKKLALLSGKDAKGNIVQEVTVMTNGAFARHPYVSDCKDLRAQIVAWCDMLMLNPTARLKAGIVVETVQKADPVEQMIEMRQVQRSELEAAVYAEVVN